jgi:hypothetical protein
MKKLIFLCVLTLVMASCTSTIKDDSLVHPKLDEITTLVLNTADSTVLQACIVVDDQVIILPKYTSEDVAIVKNYDVAGIIVLSVLAGFALGAIVGIIAAD